MSSASAHWLGTTEGSSRHLTYLGNITYVMRLLPDDAVPVMRSLTVPATSRAAVAVAWTARDNLAVTGYQVRTRPAGGSWSAPLAVAGTSLDGRPRERLLDDRGPSHRRRRQLVGVADARRRRRRRCARR